MSDSSVKYDLRGKVALVTGSSSGIGEAIAIQLAQHGAKVTITGRNVETLAEVANKITQISFGEEPLQIVGDLVQDDDLPQKLVSKTVERFGQVDILVNNAGGGSPHDSLLNPNLMDCYEQVFQLNVRAALNLIHLTVPYLEITKGCIVNISSIAAIQPFTPVYSMSKAALDMLTKTAARELGSKGIRVNSVNPGPVLTHIYRSVGIEPTEDLMPRFIDHIKELTTLDLVPQPNEIANLVSFLVSPDAANITGSIMVSDTGSLVRTGQPRNHPDHQ